MYKVQKIILVALLFTSLIAWLFSIMQPDMMMMEVMMTLNPIAVLIFTISWTVGMAAMMFPAIVPMVLMYNRLVVEDNNNSNYHFDVSKQKNNNKRRQFPLVFSSINYSIKTIVFVASYLFVWSLTGILLLLSWSILMNNLFTSFGAKELDIVYGFLLVISGLYQFSSLKRKCLGYCESPLAFFTKRWKGNSIIGTVKMGTYHGLYCLGCCWPYFLLMVALGWMNIAWMGLFAGIIFGEKIWTKGILISRFTGIAFAIVGTLTIFGMITLYNDTMNMNTMNM